MDEVVVPVQYLLGCRKCGEAFKKKKNVTHFMGGSKGVGVRGDPHLAKRSWCRA